MLAYSIQEIIEYNTTFSSFIIIERLLWECPRNIKLDLSLVYFIPGFGRDAII